MTQSPRTRRITCLAVAADGRLNILDVAHLDRLCCAHGVSREDGYAAVAHVGDSSLSLRAYLGILRGGFNCDW
jgi:hypothetical protein